MLRKLLVSTALAGVLATGAYAQDSEQSSDAATEGQTQEMQSEQGSSDASGSDASGGEMSASSDSQASGDFLQQLSSDQYLASNLTGQSIYGSDAEDAEAVATIDNYLVGSDGQIVAAIVTTAGEESKTVAIPFDQISWSMQEGEPRATMASGGDDLGSMPTFMMPGEQEQQEAASGEGSGAEGGGSTEQSGMASEDSASGDMAASGGSASETDPSSGGEASGSGGSSDTAATGGSDTSGSGGSSDMAASGGSGSEASSDTASSGGSSDVPTSVGQDQFLSQNLIGADVLSGPGEDAESVGEINDLVVSSSGAIEAGVIGVGGFLGIGEKDVAVPFDGMKMSKQEDGTPQVVYASDRAQLEEAPSFSSERPEEGGEGQQSSGDQASGDQQASEGSGTNSDGGTGDNTTEAGDSAAAAAAGSAAGSAAAEADQAASEAGSEMEQAGDQAAQSADNATDEASQAADQAAQSTENAADEAGTEMAQADDSSAASSDSSSSGDQASGDSASSEGGQSDMQPLDDTSSLTADDLIGTSVVGPDNESVGDVGDIVLSQDGGIEAVIIDVGGFLGIGEKPVSVSMDELQFMQDSGGSLSVQTQMTEDQLENAPEYTPEESAAGGSGESGSGGSSDGGSSSEGQSN
ncbi:PRC-barrel domain-containing protein [Fulvimarina sp. MAC8]|uniref:PRC-barrel domain-containing protein n=1 Tax=Fulvimarina sp. MAC8 TaxID=3162874 RepID=UPI0032F015ED